MPITAQFNPFGHEWGHIFVAYQSAHCDIIEGTRISSVRLTEEGLFECTYRGMTSKMVLTADIALADDGVEYEIFDFKVSRILWCDVVFSYSRDQENAMSMRTFTSLLEELFMLRFWDGICDRIRAGQFEDCSAPRPH